MKIEIVQDEFCDSPRDNFNLGTLAVINNRHIYGDETISRDMLDEIMNDHNYISLPVYAYIHSGVALNTTGFSCPWDSGQIGCIYISRAKVRKEFGVKRITARLYDQILHNLRDEVEAYSSYLNGDVYGYIITNDDNVIVDSCYGFIGYDTAQEAANEAVKFVA